MKAKSVRAVVAGMATWSLALGPSWYPIALVVLAITQCRAGGWIFGMLSGRRA